MIFVCERCEQPSDILFSADHGARLCPDCMGPRGILETMLLCVPLMRMGRCDEGHYTVTPNFEFFCPVCERIEARRAA